jgi:hypothetical protein
VERFVYVSVLTLLIVIEDVFIVIDPVNMEGAVQVFWPVLVCVEARTMSPVPAMVVQVGTVPAPPDVSTCPFVPADPLKARPLDMVTVAVDGCKERPPPVGAATPIIVWDEDHSPHWPTVGATLVPTIWYVLASSGVTKEGFPDPDNVRLPTVKP